MSGLPPAWVWTTINEIAFTSSGGTPSRTRADFYGGAIPWVKSGELNDGVVRDAAETITEDGLQNSSAKVFPSGTLCIALYGATVGRVGILAMDAATNQAVCGITPNAEISAEYLLYFLQSRRSALIRQSQGGAQPNISQQIVRSTEVPLCSAAEQDRIVAEIEKQFTRLDAAKAALKRVQANLKRYRVSVLKAACEGRLVPMEAELTRKEGRDYEPADKLLQRILRERRSRWEDCTLAKMMANGKPPKDDRWKEKYKEPSRPDIKNLPSLPMGWCVASLEQLTSESRPICYGILMPKGNVTDGVLYVKVKDMKGDRIDLQNLHRTSREIASAYQRASLRTGDILLAIRGTYGRVAEVPKELDGGNITQDTVRLDLSPLVNRQFLITSLRAPDCQEYFKRVARGVAVKGVNVADVRTCPILLAPIREQEAIASAAEAQVSTIDTLEPQIKSNLLRVSGLRASILRMAYTGGLVPQDPNDEPTSTVLARIRAQRLSAAPKKLIRRMDRMYAQV